MSFDQRYSLDDDKARNVGEDDLVDHISYTHLEPTTLLWYGIPRFDVELAYVKGFSLQGVIDSGLSDLENFRTPSFNSHRILHRHPTLGEYRVMLISSLALIENHKLGVVDWSRVEPFLPYFDRIIRDQDLQVNEEGITKRIKRLFRSRRVYFLE